MTAEEQIRAQLSAALDKLERAEAEKNAPVEYDEPESAPNETPLDPIRAKFELYEFFDVPAWARNSPEVQGQVEGIIAWASDEAKYLSENPTLADMLQVINDQLRIMGARSQPDKVRRLWQFTKIRQQRKLLEQKERGLYGA